MSICTIRRPPPAYLRVLPSWYHLQTMLCLPQGRSAPDSSQPAQLGQADATLAAAAAGLHCAAPARLRVTFHIRQRQQGRHRCPSSCCLGCDSRLMLLMASWAGYAGILCVHAGDWLALIAGWAAALGVPHVITANGALKRATYQDRIEFLASVRNKLLEPLRVQDTAAGLWRGELLDTSDTNGTADGAKMGMQQRHNANRRSTYFDCRPGMHRLSCVHSRLKRRMHGWMVQDRRIHGFGEPAACRSCRSALSSSTMRGFARPAYSACSDMRRTWRVAWILALCRTVNTGSMTSGLPGMQTET